VIGLISGVVSLALLTLGAIPGLILSLFALYLLTRSDSRVTSRWLNLEGSILV
jgi:hypothetical protein